MKKFLFILPLLFIVSLSFSQIIPQGATWKYLDDGSNQGTVWRQPGFDDNSWAEGPAQLGYGEGDEATVLSYGGNSLDRYITYYFRKIFMVQNPQEKPVLKLGILCDDGAVVYLNGQEVVRTNLPDGEINYQTKALKPVTGDKENTFYSFEIPSSLLNPGDNSIAVEVHQISKTSADLSFDLQMSFTDPNYFRKAPYLLYTGSNEEMMINWQMDSTRTCLLNMVLTPPIQRIP